MDKIRIFLLLVATLFITRCEASPNTFPTATEESPMTIPVRILQPIGTATSPPTSLPDCTPSEALPRHTVVADIDYPAHTVNVQQRIRYTNQTGQPLDEIVLNIEPGAVPNTLTITRPETYTLVNKRLLIPLEETLPPDCETTLNLAYTLHVPLIGSAVNASKGHFGYPPRQMNLGHWLATLAPYQNDEWITRQTMLIGEQEIAETAVWNVTLNLLNPPENLITAAPGTKTEISATSYRYVFDDARDFPVSLSDSFILNSAITDEGVTVELYTLPTPNNSAEQALEVATQSYRMYSDLFGALPYDRMLVVQGDFPDGMELSGLVFVGDSWFTRYADNPASYLTLITVHEVSHQWWYARIGNDPALNPWLDEALATYSEYIFIEEYYPDLRNWWWQFRVDAYAPIGFVDSTVYEFSNVREYINAVYLRGVRMLNDLREDIGTEAFFQLLADYAAAGNGQIATPDLFWSLLTPEQLELTQETRSRYLRGGN